MLDGHDVLPCDIKSMLHTVLLLRAGRGWGGVAV